MDNFILIGVFVLLGMLFKRLKGFPEDTAQVLNMFALYVSLPALILLKVPHLNFSRELVVAAATPWALLLLSVALVLAAARVRGWSRPITAVLLLVVPIGNTSFMGVPMVQAFFGEAGLPYLIIYDQFGTILIFATYGSLILALFGKEGRLHPANMARKVLLFPPFMALLAGLILRPWWDYPQALTAALHSISAPLIPLVMTAIGFQLRWRLQPTVLAPLGFGLAVKLLIAPIAALLFFRLSGLSGLAVDVSIIEAGMPPMVTAGALAVAAGLAPELAVALVGLGIILAFVTLPLVYLLL